MTISASLQLPSSLSSLRRSRIEGFSPCDSKIIFGLDSCSLANRPIPVGANAMGPAAEAALRRNQVILLFHRYFRYFEGANEMDWVGLDNN